MSEAAGVRPLTRALVESVGPTQPDSRRRAIEPIPSELAGLARRCSDGGMIRLTDHEIRMALAAGATGRSRVPFAWSAHTARRALGLAALRGLVTGEVRSPSEGVRSAIEQATRSVRDGHRPASSMDTWLAGLPSAGRAAVGGEAVTWATRVWCALDWSAFAFPPVIGRDYWWDGPPASHLALRSRAEVRVGPAHLVVLGGQRRSTIRSELSVMALVESLRARGVALPEIIVGWWPDSGHFVRVTVDQAVLEEGVATVARALFGGAKQAAA